MGRPKNKHQKKLDRPTIAPDGSRAAPVSLSPYMKLEAAAEYFGTGISSIRTVIENHEVDFVPHFGKYGSVRRSDMELLWDKLAESRKWNANPELKKLKESHQWRPGPPPARLKDLPHYRCAGLYRLVEIPKKKFIGPGLGELKKGAIMLYTLDSDETVCIVTKVHDRGLDAISLNVQHDGQYPSVIFKNIPVGFLRDPLFPPVRVRSQAVVGEVVGYTTVNRQALPCVVTKVRDHSIIDAVVVGNERESILEDRPALPAGATSPVRMGQMMLCIVNREVFPCMVTKVHAQPFVDAMIFTNQEYGSYPNLFHTLTLMNMPLEALKDC